MKHFNKNKIKLVNKAIAEFEGRVNTNWNTISCYPVDDLRYHSSWDWLMPVIIKIATEIRFRTRFHLSGFPINVSVSGSGGTYIAINQGNCAGEEYKGKRIIADTLNLNYCINDETMEYKPIELAWIAVAHFIEWYKKNKE
ncbi:MAG: hypothetical protein WC428_02430 [Candidatus Paceibacterota bacterium]